MAADRKLSRFSALHIAGRLVSLREARGWSRGAMAFELGITWGSLRNLEEGRSQPSLGTLLSYVRVLGLASIEEVLGDGRLGTTVLLDLEEAANIASASSA